LSDDIAIVVVSVRQPVPLTESFSMVTRVLGGPTEGGADGASKVETSRAPIAIILSTASLRVS
jgi:hypothetical protein